MAITVKKNFVTGSTKISNWRKKQIVKFMGPTWGPPGSCRPQMGPILAPWTLLSGKVCEATNQGPESVRMSGQVQYITIILPNAFWTLLSVVSHKAATQLCQHLVLRITHRIPFCRKPSRKGRLLSNREADSSSVWDGYAANVLCDVLGWDHTNAVPSNLQAWPRGWYH